MIAILLFLLGVFVIAGWWLTQQGVFSKPWLESGPNSIKEGRDRMAAPKAKIGLGIFLVVVGCMFVLFTSGIFMRMEFPDWRALPMPPVVWVNTGLLFLGSIALHLALSATRKHDLNTVKIGLLCAGGAAFGFLFGQVMAWRQLTEGGYALVDNPANSFFYMITAIHGLHILGGLVAWGRATYSAYDGLPMDQLRPRLELCATYWHFLLIVWLVLLMVLIGWADNPLELLRQLLS